MSKLSGTGTGHFEAHQVENPLLTDDLALISVRLESNPPRKSSGVVVTAEGWRAAGELGDSLIAAQGRYEDETIFWPSQLGVVNPIENCKR